MEGLGSIELWLLGNARPGVARRRGMRQRAGDNGPPLNERLRIYQGPAGVLINSQLFVKSHLHLSLPQATGYFPPTAMMPKRYTICSCTKFVGF